MKPEDWPIVIRCTEKLQHGDGTPARWNEPAALVTKLTDATFLNGPTEYSSNNLPTRVRSAGPDYLSIDELYGSYQPRTRTIEIYQKRILQDHQMFNCSPEELTQIVRIHEYAHAVVHIGVRQRALGSVVSQIGSDNRTDWKTVLRARNRSFRRIPQEAHELLAQSITWAAVEGDDQLTSAFRALEMRQAPEYQLSENIKQASSSAEWPLILEAARGEAGPVPRKSGFRSALEHFIGAAG